MFRKSGHDTPLAVLTEYVYNGHMKKVRVNVMLGENQLAALKKKVAKEDTSVSRVLRQLIDQYLRESK